ncbi:MAG: DNA mismatch repair endonuclease MutL [Christensenellales bacterium]|jgi:DNA mismatch repair protein MutL
MPIHILDDAVASKIAAGEVIERPASIIKELVENSIDAEATAISVDIKNGGIPYIRVSDNGVGMSGEDAALCFGRHATSKISSVQDLTAIETLGFRGEALYSIASVAQVELITRARGCESGTKIVIHGGVLKQQEEVGCPEGTSIVVRNLFFNTPARLKFLKKMGIEAGYVGDIVARQALNRPEISFKYSNNDKTIYFTSGSGSVYDSIYAIYGKDVAAYLHPVAAQSGGYTISGFVGAPEIARGNRTAQSLFVNRRYVHPGSVSSAVLEAYDTRLMVHRFPFFVLHLTLPFNEVDSNVHPNKLEVRYHQEQKVLELVRTAVQDAVRRPLYSPGNMQNAARLSSDAEESTVLSFKKQPLEQPTEPIQLNNIERIEYESSLSKEALFSAVETDTDLAAKKPLRLRQQHTIFTAQQPSRPSHPPEGGQNTLPQPQGASAADDGLSGFRLLGTVFSTYIMIQQEDTLLIIDQHAAHERILYDRFMQRFAEGNAVSQPVLESPEISLTPLEKETVQQSMALFEEIGFQLEEFGPLSYRIGAVPFILGEPQNAISFFREYLDNIHSYGSREAVARRRNKLISLSCKKAVKAGDVLSHAEISALVSAFVKEGHIPNCPHGRPVMVALSQKELEKYFGR